MKPCNTGDLTIGFFMLTVSVPIHAQSGGPYVLDWSTIDGGGATSSGGSYVLRGTVGQPDAGRVASCDHHLSGGLPCSCPGLMVSFR